MAGMFRAEVHVVSAGMRSLTYRGMVATGLVAALGLLLGFQAVVSDAVVNAHAHRAASAFQAQSEPTGDRRVVVARSAE